MGRTKFHEGVDEIQADLDAYLVSYNTKLPHQGDLSPRFPPVRVT